MPGRRNRPARAASGAKPGALLRPGEVPHSMLRPAPTATLQARPAKPPGAGCLGRETGRVATARRSSAQHASTRTRRHASSRAAETARCGQPRARTARVATGRRSSAQHASTRTRRHASSQAGETARCGLAAGAKPGALLRPEEVPARSSTRCAPTLQAGPATRPARSAPDHTLQGRAGETTRCRGRQAGHLRRRGGAARPGLWLAQHGLPRDA